MEEHALDDWLETCELAARAGGQKILSLRGHFQTRVKAPADLVTDADVASQEAIRHVIAGRYPDHAFVGEEQSTGSAPKRQRVGSGLLIHWTERPITCTATRTTQFRWHWHKGSTLLVGTVYDPVADLCFVAGADRGAWCNGERMSTSRVTSVADALVAVSLPAHVQSDSPDLLDFIQASQACQAVRRTGSAALNFAYVAKGALDAFWATHIHPWDVAAGVLLVREAGGVVTARTGGEFDLRNPNFLAAANDDLHAGLMETLRHAAD